MNKLKIILWILYMFMNTIAHSKDFKKLSNLIEPTSNFVNREKEINLISESFKKSKKILSITGISGIGKTQLLRRYVSNDMLNCA